MKVNAITLRPGHILEKDDKLWKVLKHEIIHPGKGQSVIQVELRDIESGTKDNVRFRTQETIERARLEQADYQFLFKDGDIYTFMNNETFEQLTITEELIGDQSVYLQDGMQVSIESYEERPIGVSLPDSVTLEVVETEPVVKGQTASSSYKPAIVDNGVRVMVPPHIDPGTRIVVKTEDGTYVERAKD
ncbi:MAG: elongation factor P [Micavibrio sp.]|nr:elongation factor P [Micavibrio sp.]HCK33197.1 elongation factor P [Rhodospirillaceae bacterium]|tara:strand:- start:617 stop:1183 length:567 start_codon:yes stop_codon:yes gene_type:complete